MSTGWPTTIDYMWLALGLVALGWVAWRALRHGLETIGSLGSLGVIILWIGYHLKPWLALPVGRWSSFLLHEAYITEGIAYSSLAMLAFIIGYMLPRGIEGKLAVNATRAMNVPPSAVLILSLLSASLAIISVGGIENFWSWEYYRGYGQYAFTDKTSYDKIKNVLDILASLVSFITAGLAMFLIAKPTRRRRLFRWVIGIIGIVAASLKAFWKFSRASGFGFALLGIGLIWYRGWRGVPAALVAMSVAVWLGWTGFTQRGAYTPGLSNFVTALVSTSEDGSLGVKAGGAGGWLDPNINVLDALDAWTARAWTRDQDAPTIIGGIIGLAAALQPIPSQLVPFKVEAGERLSKVMGTWGLWDLTTPALGEIYYLLGYLGLVTLIGIGAFSRWVQNGLLHRKYSSLFIIPYLGSIMGFVVSLHSGVRAMTRPMLYSLIVLGVAVFIMKLAGARKRTLLRPAVEVPRNRDDAPRRSPRQPSELVRRTRRLSDSCRC